MVSKIFKGLGVAAAASSLSALAVIAGYEMVRPMLPARGVDLRVEISQRGDETFYAVFNEKGKYLGQMLLDCAHDNVAVSTASVPAGKNPQGEDLVKVTTKGSWHGSAPEGRTNKMTQVTYADETRANETAHPYDPFHDSGSPYQLIDEEPGAPIVTAPMCKAPWAEAESAIEDVLKQALGLRADAHMSFRAVSPIEQLQTKSGHTLDALDDLKSSQSTQVLNLSIIGMGGKKLYVVKSEEGEIMGSLLVNCNKPKDGTVLSLENPKVTAAFDTPKDCCPQDRSDTPDDAKVKHALEGFFNDGNASTVALVSTKKRNMTIDFFQSGFSGPVVTISTSPCQGSNAREEEYGGYAMGFADRFTQSILQSEDWMRYVGVATASPTNARAGLPFCKKGQPDYRTVHAMGASIMYARLKALLAHKAP